MSISAMKQALEALEDYWKVGPQGTDDAITALRQAIAEAEKQEPVAQCTYPKCQATSGCVGVCSKTSPTAWAEITKEYVAVSDEPFENATPLYATPVHASDMSEKHVHESDKHRHEPVAWREVAGKTTHYYDYNEQGRGEPLYAAPVQEDWYGQHQWQCGYERGWDAAMEKKENSLPLMQEGKDFTVSKPWVGLTDDEIWECFTLDHVDFARAIEAKLKEKNCA